ncbi:MAG: hypothetical protein PHI52_07500 [Bacteroidales bacterium]|nr:hypothetical protein [Bacteroidales bacterium]
MKRTLIYFLILISFTTYGQNFKIESNFKTEKTYKFTVKRAKIDSKKAIIKDLAQLTQIEAVFTQSGTLLKCVWKYGDTKVVGPKDIISQIGPEYNELFNIYKGIEIEVLFDPNNGGIELLNYNKMKENIKNGLLKIYKNQMTKIDSATMAIINQQLEPTYSSPEILISTYFPEIALYFNLYSQNLITGISIESEYFYPNPFGGEAFPIIGEIKIDSQIKKLLIIKNREQAKQEEVNRIIKDMIEEMSKQGDSPIKKEEIPNFTVNSESYYYYDIKKKIINKVKLEKKIEISGITQTEILEVNLIK